MFPMKDVQLYREQKHPPVSNPTECLTHLMMSEVLTDLTIIIPGHGDNFKVHRLVLSMWSGVFQAMLFGSMAEGDTITLAEDPPEAFRWLLNYMYTGQTKLPSVDLALQVYLLANKYLMEHLKTVCSKYLIDAVRATSVPEVLNIASLMEDEALINKCAEVLGSSPDSFFSSPTIGSLSSDSLKQLLTKDVRISSESVIFKGILNWGKAQLKLEENKITTLNLRQEVEKFLPQVQFLTMTLEEFVVHVLPENILTLKEVESIQLNIAGIPEVDLPPLFSNKKKHRNIFHISHLNRCDISGDKLLSYSPGYTNTREVNLLSNIRCVNNLILSKLECEGKIGFSGLLTVKNSNGIRLRSVNFDGRVAKFDDPLQMLPTVSYTFTINSSEPQKILHELYNTKSNDLLSVTGSMSVINKVSDPCILYFWK